MTEVYKAIAAIQGELAKTGISKDRKNEQQGYKFRGIDDVYGALSPLLSKHGLCILPRMLTRDIQERRNSKGTALFYVTVEAEFDFVAVADGTMHTVRTFGEAMDSGDKATNKAMSAAYKYAAFQAFAIPTEGDNDADAVTHEVVAAFITEEQSNELRYLVEQTNSDAELFCKYYKVASIPKLPADRFDHARAALLKKIPSSQQEAA